MIFEGFPIVKNKIPAAPRLTLCTNQGSSILFHFSLHSRPSNKPNNNDPLLEKFIKTLVNLYFHTMSTTKNTEFSKNFCLYWSNIVWVAIVVFITFCSLFVCKELLWLAPEHVTHCPFDGDLFKSLTRTFPICIIWTVSETRSPKRRWWKLLSYFLFRAALADILCCFPYLSCAWTVCILSICDSLANRSTESFSLFPTNAVPL